MKTLRTIIFTLAALLICASAQASFTVVKSAGNFASAASFTLTFSVAAGHDVVVCMLGQGSGATASIATDTGANPYTNGAFSVAAGRVANCAYSLAIANAITSITVTPSGTGTLALIAAWDVTSTGTASFPTGGSNNFIGTTATGTDAVTTGSMTVSSADAIFFSLASDLSSGNLTVGTGFSLDTTLSANNIISEHKAVTATGAATYTAAGAGDTILLSGIALQNSATVANGVVISNGKVLVSNGHPVYQ